MLGVIQSLSKLCNHPRLVYPAQQMRDSGKKGKKGKGEPAGFDDAYAGCAHLFPDNFDVRGDSRCFGGRSRNSGRGSNQQSNGDGGIMSELSGKMAVLDRLLCEMRARGKERIVVVSNFTQTLDQITLLCRERFFPCVRLDGSMAVKKRRVLVEDFNDATKDQFVFLLSSKAGGCGLNLIGGNRLILFDPDWNPATDKQAAARVWRDGQKKRCYVCVHPRPCPCRSALCVLGGLPGVARVRPPSRGVPPHFLRTWPTRPGLILPAPHPPASRHAGARAFHARARSLIISDLIYTSQLCRRRARYLRARAGTGS